MSRPAKHISVLLREVVEGLAVKPSGKYVDATLGGGGHAVEILSRGGRVLGIDWDKEALKAARKRLDADFPKGKWQLARGNFAKVKQICGEAGWSKVGGVLFDLGLSSIQLNTARRGFAFRKEGPLDMRMDERLGVTASDLVNALSEKQLREVFSNLGEERLALSISRRICQARAVKKIETTKGLADLVARVYQGKGKWGAKIHPATRVFMALRMAVNFELDNLREGLNGAVEILRKNGRLVVISFHSGEDRIVKQTLQEWKRVGVLKTLTDKPIVPSESEININPRSRSAKLRIAEKI